mmetsp:Transcript_299/g.517  ORF Transcript_299/g.517 Transcript_299/m.517 type:complete len:291 (-) Transcript_299:362-1234(-)
MSSRTCLLALIFHLVLLSSVAQMVVDKCRCEKAKPHSCFETTPSGNPGECTSVKRVCAGCSCAWDGDHLCDIKEKQKYRYSTSTGSACNATLGEAVICGKNIKEAKTGRIATMETECEVIGVLDYTMICGIKCFPPKVGELLSVSTETSIHWNNSVNIENTNDQTIRMIYFTSQIVVSSFASNDSTSQCLLNSKGYCSTNVGSNEPTAIFRNLKPGQKRSFLFTGDEIIKKTHSDQIDTDNYVCKTRQNTSVDVTTVAQLVNGYTGSIRVQFGGLGGARYKVTYTYLVFE